MLIEHILQRKGSDVATTTPSTAIGDVIETLQERRIGAMVVLGANGVVVGIISERDIVWALTEHGAGLLDQPVQNLMSTDLTTCTRQSTADDLMRLMTEHRIRHIPVVEKGQLVGIVSIGDVVKSRIDELETETETLHEYLATGRS